MTTTTESRAFLLDTVKLQQGDTIWTVLRHVNRSGDYRAIDCYIIRDNQPIRISFHVANVTGYRYDDKHEAIGAKGGGMDMGYAIVDDLSRALFDKGYTFNHSWM